MVLEALDRVRLAPLLLDVLRLADGLAMAARRHPDPAAAVRLLEPVVLDEHDQLSAIAAVHALGVVFDDSADALLVDLLSHHQGFLREHAAWSLGHRLARLDAIGRLVGLVVGGGFAGMVAQRTLEHWARVAPDHVGVAVEAVLQSLDDVQARTRLAETIGLVPGPIATAALARLAGDEADDVGVRVASVAALGSRPGAVATDTLDRLARLDGLLGDAARLAIFDQALAVAPQERMGSGLRVAQLFLHADLDRELTHAGVGDNGGIATLLVRLGDAMAAEPAVDGVVTLVRGGDAEALDVLEKAGEWCGDGGHLLVPIPLPGHVGPGLRGSWPGRVAVERGVARALRAFGPFDVVHLRMGDVGTLAAATVAARLNVPVVFTLAPDPHALIHSLDMTGRLGRDTFGTADATEHYWFRARLVQRLAAEAQHLVVFPRPALVEDLRELLGVDLIGQAARCSVVAEGIDLGVTAAARHDVERAAAGACEPALDDLASLVASLPAHRHGLPLAITVGRLHAAKGMAVAVEAWASDPGLHRRCNLLVVGGDLDHPSADEQAELDRIHDVLRRHPAGAEGLLLAGHRPNGVVARFLAAAHAGLPPLVAPHGAYVCASLKEEFGLAIVEALAAGLAVVAPFGGGPATYVRDGVTGVLADTSDPGAVARALARALELSRAPGTVERARATVDDHYTLSHMAKRLAAVYRLAAGARTLAHPVSSDAVHAVEREAQ